MNGKVLDEDFDRNIDEEVLRCKEEKQAKDKEHSKEAKILDICRKPELLRAVLVLGLIFLAANYEYYGSIFGVEALSSNIYINSL